MERTQSCGHDMTTSTFQGPADGRQRQSTGNGVRDWMCLRPKGQHWGVDQGRGRLSRGESMRGAGWGDRGTEQL